MYTAKMSAAKEVVLLVNDTNICAKGHLLQTFETKFIYVQVHHTKPLIVANFTEINVMSSVEFC